MAQVDVKTVNRRDGMHAAAAPAAGTFAKGERVWNSNPASGQPMGWICTVAGTPGTWVAMANLA